MFSLQVVLSKTTRVVNTLCGIVCHASLNFIDPFDNLKRVNLFDTCSDETPFCLLIFRSDNPLLKTDIPLYLKKKSQQIFDFTGKMDTKAGEPAMQ